KVQVGDVVLAMGNPFGVGQTVTMGIVSATGRGGLGIEDYEDFIQTDAPINPGNSGGALVNDRGELVGINTAIISRAGGSQGVGFAVPSDLAHQVMNDLLKDGKVTRAYLGIVPQNVTTAIAKAFGAKENRGALVGDVSPNSPAQRAGVQTGDIILEVNGKTVEDSNQLRNGISMMRPGSTVQLKVLRNGSERDLTAKLDEFPEKTTQAKLDKEGSHSALDGVTTENLDAGTRAQLRLPANTQGVVVTDVDAASKAAESGLQPGDVIQQANHKPVKDTADLANALNNSGNSNLLLVNRHGMTLFVAV
ncbi:MAG: PDZ domain-containing protein, partial [Bryobacterales bacterium]|nr:PDZ domain-containing protein [Bryobacterales bacterium]